MSFSWNKTWRKDKFSWNSCPVMSQSQLYLFFWLHKLSNTWSVGFLSIKRLQLYLCKSDVKPIHPSNDYTHCPGHQRLRYWYYQNFKCIGANDITALFQVTWETNVWILWGGRVPYAEILSILSMLEVKWLIS